MRSTRRMFGALGVTLVVLVAGVPLATGTATAAPYCGITWGSLDKFSAPYTGAMIVDARTGRQDCYDRLVIDLNGKPAPGYTVRYDTAFRDVGGTPRPTAGGAILSITAQAWAWDFTTNRSSVPWTVGQHIVSPSQFSAGGYLTFRDLVYGGTYESHTRFGLGVRARLPFRVFTLDGPGTGSRLVIDVAHQW